MPLHTWLPDAGAEAPVGAGALLVGVLDKVGTFGFLRYCLPLFPQASRDSRRWCSCWRWSASSTGRCSRSGRSDLKRFVAYTSIAHFGFIALGIFAFTTQAFAGAVLYMVNHGLATGLLFLVVGMLAARGGSRLIGDYGGVGQARPAARRRASCSPGWSSLALPGTNSFVSRVPGAGRHLHARARATRSSPPSASSSPPCTCSGSSSRRCRGRCAAGRSSDALGSDRSGGAPRARMRRRPRRDDRSGDRGPPCGLGLPGPDRPRDRGAGAADRR